MEDSDECMPLSSDGTMFEKSGEPEGTDGEKIETAMVRPEAEGGVGETGIGLPIPCLPVVWSSSGVESVGIESGGSVTETTGPRGDGAPRTGELENVMSPSR